MSENESYILKPAYEVSLQPPRNHHPVSQMTILSSRTLLVFQAHSLLKQRGIRGVDESMEIPGVVRARARCARGPLSGHLRARRPAGRAFAGGEIGLQSPTLATGVVLLFASLVDVLTRCQGSRGSRFLNTHLRYLRQVEDKPKQFEEDVFLWLLFLLHEGLS